MTDNEIIMALEDFADILNGAICFRANERGAKEYYETLTNALDLINRQNAKIERLEAKCENTQVGYNIARAETEEYKEINKSLKADRPFLIANAKAEAVKEFFEKLKEIASYDEIWTGEEEYVYKTIDFDEVKDLVEEMVGDTE